MTATPNQNPEQIARDTIDARLRAAGWQVQDKGAIDFEAGFGIAVREYQTGTSWLCLPRPQHPIRVRGRAEGRWARRGGASTQFST